IVSWGDSFAQRITLTNRARLAIPAIRVTDLSTLPDHPHGYVTSLPARRSVTWDVEIPCQQRGRYRLGPVETHMSDPLGLFPVSRLVGAATSVLVLPRWVPLNRCALRLDGFLPGEARGRRRGESPPSFYSVREYAVGDNIATIHWPASARSGQLMTKLFDPEIQTTLWLALDLDGSLSHDVEELLVTAAVSLGVYALHRANLRVGLLASGDVSVQLPSERGKPHQYRMQEVLAEVRAGDEVALNDLLTKLDRRLGPGQVVVLLTSRGPEAWGTALNRLARKGVAARVVNVSDTSAGWAVPAISLSPTLADPAREAALIQQLEHGAASGGEG
ncbi:MAG TPA: DUF58 domain-containing protein, partial [Ktedonobacterales bacterium]|nr:DUF58 domain-containing protein [Ktedonobacterales bacterium]